MRSVYRQLGERASHALATLGALGMTMALGGCAADGKVAGLGPGDDITASIPAASPMISPTPALGAEDWGIASKALAIALDPQGPGAAVAWENPASGAGGSMTPVGFVYSVDGLTCRAFIAEIAGLAPVQRLQGRGCREGPGDWAVSDLRPFGP